MRVVFFGTPDFAVPPLKSLCKSKHEIVAVVTQPDRQSGRGRHIKSCPVKIEAEKEGHKVLQPRNIKEIDFINEIKHINPDVIVVVAYGQIFPPEIINLPEFGCVNIHASLLPDYRGAAPINWVIIKGEEKTGVTTMLMDEGMDTGPVLLQAEMAISREDTAGSLSEKLSLAGADLLIKTLEGLKTGSLKPASQTDNASYAPILEKNDGFIKWENSAEEICNFIRGMNPWPGAHGFLNGERIKVMKAYRKEGNAEKGVVYKVTKNELLVGSGRGLVSIAEIQPPGKPVMDIRAFLQGRKIKEGMKFRIKIK